jgi:hypothetical protein
MGRSAVRIAERAGHIAVRTGAPSTSDRTDGGDWVATGALTAARASTRESHADLPGSSCGSDDEAKM